MLIGVIAMLSMSSCTRTVDENTVGVCIKRPYMIGSSGTEVLKPGRYVVAWSSSIEPLFSTPMKYKETFTNLTTKDKSDVDFDFYFNLQIVQDQANVLYSDFTLEWYKTNLQPEFRRIIRDKGMAYDMIPITSDPKVAQEIENYVLAECRKFIEKSKVPVVLNSVSMGKADPPKEVTVERSATAAAKQRANTLIQDGKNLDTERNNEGRRALKDQEYMKKMKLSTAQFVQLEQLRVQEVAYEKASTVIVDGSSGMKPTYPIK